eukprot:CAMPEP_0113457720 /NCGR_PEP_ID=MMETSP0014_2-20120614/9553_1 /TAXON_ID=2857 /ORGANISM="Nitzschia sp." /LENGTH=676 /DNA_ID=CAMNT_0000349223 /DNA_START=782 /DNA_END=2812 /DNA_ORIENTATION=- /assembly_acc=CAM_ASM_000159
MTFPPHFYNRRRRYNMNDDDNDAAAAAAGTKEAGTDRSRQYGFVSLGGTTTTTSGDIDINEDRTVKDDSTISIGPSAPPMTNSGLKLIRPRAVSGEVLKGAKLLAGISTTAVSKVDMESLSMSMSMEEQSITGGVVKKRQQLQGLVDDAQGGGIMLRVSPTPTTTTPTFVSITDRFHHQSSNRDHHRHDHHHNHFMVRTSKSFESISPLPSREEEEDDDDDFDDKTEELPHAGKPSLNEDEFVVSQTPKVMKGSIDDPWSWTTTTLSTSTSTTTAASGAAATRTIAPTISPFNGYRRQQQQQQQVLKPSSAALVTPNIGFQRSTISTSTSQRFQGKEGTRSPPYFPSTSSLMSSSSSRHSGHQQTEGRRIQIGGGSSFGFPPHNMLSAMTFPAAPPNHFRRPTMMPGGPTQNLHRSSQPMIEESRQSNKGQYRVNKDIPVKNAPPKKRKLHSFLSRKVDKNIAKGPKTTMKKKSKKKKVVKTLEKKQKVSRTVTKKVPTASLPAKKIIESVKSDTKNGCSTVKKFSWKRYPLLEKFLISNREEYLSYSARNYTSEQKEYNNKLTARVLNMANGFGYTDLTNPEIFTFSTVRDKIRCYYKSFVQSSKRRGDGSPLDKYYEQHRREKLGLPQQKQKQRRKDRTRVVKKELRANQLDGSQGLKNLPLPTSSKTSTATAA